MSRPTRSDVEKACLATEANKTLCLLQVKSVRLRRGRDASIDWYEIRIDGGLQIAATALHAFTCLRDSRAQPLLACDLRKDDQVWIDVGQLLSDGSITFIEGGS